MIAYFKNYKKHIPIAIVLAITILLHLAFLLRYGPMYGLDSDDLSYVNAGITFYNTGQVTMHGVLSAQIMPGMPWLIGLFVFIFGKGEMLWWALKIFWNILGVLCVYGTYKCAREYANEVCSALASALFLTLDFIWMDNLILTETPFQFFFIWMICFSLRIAKQPNWKYYWGIVTTYMGALLIRPNVAPYPLFLFVFLYFNKYDLKVMLKQIGIAAVVVLAFIIPWTIRNYVHFDHFIPLTYGMGNPLLLGSYQGYDSPLDEDLDYQTNVIDVMPQEMKDNYHDGKWTTGTYMDKYYALELDGLKAKYRMKEWWNNDPKGMLKAYLIFKPKIMLVGSFCWDTPFGVPSSFNLPFRYFDLILCVISCIALLFDKVRRKPMLLLMSFYAFQIAVYSYSFVFDRYAQTLYFFRFIVIAWGLYTGYQMLSKRKIKK